MATPFYTIDNTNEELIIIPKINNNDSTTATKKDIKVDKY